MASKEQKTANVSASEWARFLTFLQLCVVLADHIVSSTLMVGRIFEEFFS
jgi:hypothetical protein